jgi:Rne/Rng family ribonuclease
MSRELAIEPTPSGVRAALLEAGRLIEVAILDRTADQISGAIYLARVKAVDRELAAAFVDCGLDQDAYLSARDARWLTGGDAGGPLRLVEGQAVLVQGTREPANGKGARVSADIALPGIWLLYRPRRRDLAPSARLASSGEGRALLARGHQLFPEGGIVLRRSALAASDADLVGEAERLLALWRGIEAKAAAARPPACLHALRDPIERLLLDHLSPTIERIVVGEPALVAKLRSCLEAASPSLAAQIRLEYRADAFAEAGAAEQLAEALEPQVLLAGGGSLIIEPTAALTAIDVNGAGRRAREVNLEAAAEIARQLRLRRIGGTVVVDFVDLDSKRARAELLAALRAAFADDPAPVQVFSMTALGLVPISRKRAGASLAEELRRACPTCGGRGWVGDPAFAPGAQRIEEDAR